MRRLDIPGSSPHFIGSWNLDDDGLCDDIVSFFNSHQEKQEAGQSAFAVDKSVKDSIDLTVHPRELEDSGFEPVNMYIDRLFQCYKDYIDQFPFLGEIMPKTDISSFNIQKYLPGGHFQLVHTERTSIVNSYRVLAWMTYLNSVEAGGTTYFTHQDLEVRPDKGKTLIWPAEWTHAHRGNVVESGEKYVITGWMHFPHEQR